MGGARPLLARRPRIHHDPRPAAVAPRPAPHPARTTHPAATHQPTSRRRTRRRRGRGLTSTPTEDLYAASITPLVRRHPSGRRWIPCPVTDRGPLPLRSVSREQPWCL